MKKQHSAYIKGGNYDALMIGFNRGEKWAIEEVFNLFYFYVINFVARIIGKLGGDDDAQQIAISIFELLVPKCADFENIEKVKAYIFICAKNKCLKFIDKKRRNKHKVFLCDLDDTVVASEEAIDAQIVRSEFIMEVYSAIETLPHTRKEVFKMLYIDNLSVEEVCIKLNMTRDAVYNNKFKALIDLRFELFFKHKDT